MSNYSRPSGCFRKFSLFLLSILFTINLLAADNTSQWRGPNRDGKYPDTDLLRKWPAEGPTLKWSLDGLGDGYSSPAVTENLVIVTGMKEKRGFAFAFTMNGEQVWATEYGEEWYKSYEGARTTPTVVGDLTYISSGMGNVTCLKTTTGEIVWQKNTKDLYDAEKIRWGLTESLLVYGDLVISTPGGKNNMVAFNRFDGKQIWISTGSDESSAYCSPLLVDTGQTELIVTMTAKSIIAVDPFNGNLLWKHPHKTSYDINPNTPYYQDGNLYCVSGYGTGGVQLALAQDGNSVKEIWRDENLDIQMDGFIVHKDFIYGTSHKKPAWHCLDWINGQEMWVEPGIGKANVIMAEELLYAYGENGVVALIEPSPKSYSEISSFKIEKGTNQHWAHLVIKNGLLFVRHGDVLMAFDIQK